MKIKDGTKVIVKVLPNDKIWIGTVAISYPGVYIITDDYGIHHKIGEPYACVSGVIKYEESLYNMLLELPNDAQYRIIQAFYWAEHEPLP